MPEASRPGRMTLRLSDGYETTVYAYAPAGAASGAAVLYLHGIESHPLWFASSAAALAGRGHAVFQVTRRGSGDNKAARGHADSAGQLLDDVDAAAQFAIEHACASRLHLLGVSWGGKLAAVYAGDPRRTGRLASLTLVAPGIAPVIDLRPATKLAVACALLIRPLRRFAIPLGDVSLFTDNEAMRR